MARRLTNEERKKIIQMYEQGKSFAEIQQITGRSRGAQAKVLGAVGLNEREVDMQAWKMAKLEYRRKAISEGRPDVEWENPTKVDLAPIIRK